jgi:hypothetical protein
LSSSETLIFAGLSATGGWFEGIRFCEPVHAARGLTFLTFLKITLISRPIQALTFCVKKSIIADCSCGAILTIKTAIYRP